MADICAELHRWARSLPRYTIETLPRAPKNGIYLLFEKGETAHGGERIVRVGTHTGQDQLISRLRQHFLMENKDRSIFRKNIGRALLNKEKDPYLATWEIDFTPAAARQNHQRDLKKQQEIEHNVSQYMREAFSFVLIECLDKAVRLTWESKIISTLSHCPECRPSADWLGNYSPKEKIRQSGLWLVNELYKQPLTAKELAQLRKI